MSIMLNTLQSCFPKLSISMPAMEILLIEDNQAEAFQIRRTLNQIGKIFWEDSLEAGLNATNEEQFDFVLMSLNLENECSLESFHHFCMQRPEIPVVVMSDNETRLLAEAAIHEGAMAIIDKTMIDNSDYLIKAITAIMIKVKFIKKADELLSKTHKEARGFFNFWSRNHPKR
jgi:DNA-binding NarL/FixJ family response regulator